MINKIKANEAYVSAPALFSAANSGAFIQVIYKWRHATEFVDEKSATCFRSIDLHLRIAPDTTLIKDKNSIPNYPDVSELPLGAVLQRLLFDRTDFAAGDEVFAKVILTPCDGYLIRRDIIDVRMRHSEWSDGIVLSGSWDRRLPACHRQQQSDLHSLMQSSPGVIVVKKGFSHDDINRKQLQEDLERRLSLDLVVPRRPAAHHLALVAGRSMCEPDRGVFRAQGFLEAASALGVAITVLDAPSHWMGSRLYRHLTAGFVPVDLDLTPGLPERIVEAVKGIDLDGIVTFTDEYVIATTQAAELLGLPTESLDATMQTVHKHKMRGVVNDTSVQTMFMESADQLSDPRVAQDLRALSYPLIVKPTLGRASAGVKRVDDERMAETAIRLLQENHLAEDGILVETFVNGPELDCNFVLCDGEVHFLEVMDDLPSSGDSESVTIEDHFFENVMIGATALPPAEVDIIRASLHKSLQRLGLRWGVFHSEARMVHSSMEYRDQHADGLSDLRSRRTNHDALPNGTSQPDVFLIEVNVRPPGNGGVPMAMYTYGVDYNALHILRALGDKDRFKRLAVPFAFPASLGGGGGAQSWYALCLLEQHRDGILVPTDFFDRLYDQVPEIVPYITRAEMCVTPGTITRLKGGVGILAWVLLRSRSSRTHLIRMYNTLAAVTKTILDT